KDPTRRCGPFLSHVSRNPEELWDARGPCPSSQRSHCGGRAGSGIARSSDGSKVAQSAAEFHSDAICGLASLLLGGAHFLRSWGGRCFSAYDFCVAGKRLL